MAKDAVTDADIPHILGARLRKAREKARLSEEDAAQQVQLSVARLREIESGQKVCDAKELLRLCACYDAKAEQLCAGVPEASSLAMGQDDLRRLIAQMLGNAEPSRGRNFSGLVKLLKGEC